MKAVYNAVMDSSRWDRLSFRDDDIVVASWPKSGTTWMQQIIAQLVFGGDPDLFGQAISPWIESRFLRGVHMAAEQRHRRILKTHLPADALPIEASAKYVVIARDPRDVFLSWYRHQDQLSDIVYDLMNRTPGRHATKVERQNADFATACDAWLDNDDAFVGPFWANIKSWWDIRTEPNVLLTHYSEATADIQAVALRLATFLEIEVDPTRLPIILRYCSIEHMKILASRDQGLGWTFGGNGEGFVHQGNGGRWQSLLPPRTIAKFESEAYRRLPEACARWLLSPPREMSPESVDAKGRSNG